MTAKITFKIDDSVVVKPGVMDPDLDVTIGGWQGRISAIDQKENLICIQWDSVTLKNMSAEMIDRCEEEELDWTNMFLSPEEVEPAQARDSLEDVEATVEALDEAHSWSFLGEAGQRIQTVLADVSDYDDEAAFKAWEKYLGQTLAFPFEAEVAENAEDEGPLQVGDVVSVSSLAGSEDLYGVMASVRRQRKGFVLPLCDLEVKDKNSANYQPVNDYVVWFANR